MTPVQQKIAYSLFFIFLALWLVLILAGFSSSGQFTTTIVFPNQFMLAFFAGASILTSISSLLLGLNFLGINLRLRILRHPLETDLFSSTELKNQTPEISSVNTPTNQNETKKSKDRMKAFYLYGETKFDNCAYQFGYLGGALKTKSIPDECFGCPKLIECARPTQN